MRIAKLHGWKIVKSLETITAANNTPLSCDGRVDLLIDFQGTVASVNALVTSDLNQEIIISWHDLVNLKILPANFPNKICEISQNLEEKFDTDRFNSLIEEYKDVVSDNLKNEPICGTKFKIELNEDVKPKKVLTARRIPLHFEEEAKNVIDQLIKDGIIAKQEKPSDWISPAFFVQKPNGGLRLVVDYSVTGLNKAVKRRIHPAPSGADIMKQVKPESKWFLKADCVQGYHQLLLDEESQQLTTFILPFGCYYYLRAPMGLSGSGDEFCSRTDEAFQHLPISKIVDDILLQAVTQDQLFHNLEELLKSCREHGITLSKKKLQVAQDNLKFAGYIVGRSGIKPDPAKIQALKDFPAPENVSSLRSFLGLAQQLGSFIPDLSQMTYSLRELLKKDVVWQWLPEHDQDFEEIKKLLTSEMVIQPFDPKLRTKLLTDASRLNGLGFALMQEDENGKIKLIQCGSRSLTASEKNYATVELECLGIHYGIFKCKHYLLGMKSAFDVVTDHRPLVGVFKKGLESIENTRLQRLRLKLVDFNFNVTWSAGKTHFIADALSRNPIFSPKDEEDDYSEELPSNLNIVCALQTDAHLSEIYEAAENDSDYQQLIQVISNDKKLRNIPPSHPARRFSGVFQSLSIYDGLVVKDDCQIVIPKSERKRILDLLHMPHCGESKTKANARQLYYWPGMTQEITALVGGCEECQGLRDSQQKEPLIPTEPTHPMSHVGVDLAQESGKHYIIMVDSYSGFPFCARLNNLHTGAITRQLEHWFLDFGYASHIRSDGGPQLRTEFGKWCSDNGIKHDDSSSYFPSSNGLSENGVKICKHLLIKCHSNWDVFKKALHEYRNTPRVDGYSPAQMMFGRRQKGQLPCLPSAYVNIDQDAAAAGRKKMREEQKVAYDKRAISLPQLQVGQKVYLQNPLIGRWDSTGTIVSIRENGRSYEVEGENGRKYLRNRRFLRPKTFGTEVVVETENDNSVDNERQVILRRSERLRGKKKVQINTGRNTVMYFSS